MPVAFGPLQTIYEGEVIELDLAGSWDDPQPLPPWDPIEAPLSVSVNHWKAPEDILKAFFNISHTMSAKGDSARDTPPIWR